MADGASFETTLIRKILDSFFSGKIEHRKEEYDRIGKVFQGMGGSWEGIVKGNPKEITLLKKVCKFAYKNGHLTKKSNPV